MSVAGSAGSNLQPRQRLAPEGGVERKTLCSADAQQGSQEGSRRKHQEATRAEIGGKMLQYPAIFTAAEEGGYVITFPDIPEAITQGEDEKDGLRRASDALETALEDRKS